MSSWTSWRVCAGCRLRFWLPGIRTLFLRWLSLSFDRLTCCLLPAISIVADDILVVSVGEQPATFGTPGVEENCFFMKEVRRIRVALLGCCQDPQQLPALFCIENLERQPKGHA